ncbi:hypothetical protein ACEPAI_4166 [Sanghuangporus weigelae]
MGRRKIEITPITHERNRSVTFLKRKNGLFKKAYELGVLCSVDVAVIIFEERAGHHVKLHEYCSTDVDNMVQRHLHFDGERESKHPADFSKTPDDGGHDEDDDDDDLPRPSGSGGASSSRRPGGPAGGNVGGGPGIGGRGGSGSGMGPRTSSMTNSSSGGRLSASMGLEHLERTPLSLPSHISTSFPGHYPPSQSFPSHGGHGGLSHSSFSAMHSPHPSLSTHSQSHNYAPSPTSAYPGPGSALPVSGERHSPFNFNLPQKRARLDSSASATSTGGGSSYPGGPTAYTIDDPTAHQAYLQSQGQGSGTPQSQFGLHFGRPTPSPSSTGGRALYGQGQASPPPSNASSTPSNANSFAALMPGAGGGGISPTSPHHAHRPSAGGVGNLDWPIHNASQSQSQVQPQMHSRPGGGTDSAWLDFLSSAPASGSAPGAGASASSDSSASSAPSNAGSVGGASSAASSSSTTTLTSNASTLGKRSRSDSYLEDGGESSGRVKEEERNEGGATMRRSGGQELDIFASASSNTGRERKTSDVRTGAGDVNTGADWRELVSIALPDLEGVVSVQSWIWMDFHLQFDSRYVKNPRPASALVFAAP